MRHKQDVFHSIHSLSPAAGVLQTLAMMSSKPLNRKLILNPPPSKLLRTLLDLEVDATT